MDAKRKVVRFLTRRGSALGSTKWTRLARSGSSATCRDLASAQAACSARISTPHAAVSRVPPLRDRLDTCHFSGVLGKDGRKRQRRETSYLRMMDEAEAVSVAGKRPGSSHLVALPFPLLRAQAGRGAHHVCNGPSARGCTSRPTGRPRLRDHDTAAISPATRTSAEL